MRYIILITLIDYALIALFLVASSPMSLDLALQFALLICGVAIPLRIIAGIPALWASRRISPHNPTLLISMGTAAGALIPVLISAGEMFSPMMIFGATLGWLSASLWWLLVERHPNRRAYYD